MCDCMMQELQRECRKMLQHEDQLRAQHRHELAVRRQKEEVKQRQIEDSKHIVARCVICKGTFTSVACILKNLQSEKCSESVL